MGGTLGVPRDLGGQEWKEGSLSLTQTIIDQHSSDFISHLVLILLLKNTHTQQFDIILLAT